MKDFVDRIPTKPHRYKMVKDSGGSEYVTMQLEDQPTKEGTPLNRNVFMAMQGFMDGETVINKSGDTTTITANYSDGGKSEITITKSGSETKVVDEYTGDSGEVIVKTTTITKGAGITIKEVLS